MEYIKVQVSYTEDDDGNKEYDYRTITKEFESELKKLDKNVVVLCSTFKRINKII